MPEAQEALSYVHQGLWTNWSKGRVSGATLTLSPRNGAVLIAFLALFAQMSGAQLWGILRFALHQSRVSKGPEDGLHYQQQAVLRNSSSDLSAFWQFVRISWAWRRRTRRPWLRSLPLILLTLFHFALFGLAGIMSSKLAEGGQEVLISSPFCGFFNDSFISSLRGVREDFLDVNVEYMSREKRDIQLSQQYVDSCYQTSSTTKPAVTSCDFFKKRQLSWQTTVTDACPFDSAVCPDQQQSVTFDTGFLDSRDDLGLNAKEGDRVSYRRITTCTPLKHEGYVTPYMNISSTNNSPTMQVVHAHYGPARINQFNATTTYSPPSGHTMINHLANTSPYSLQMNWAYAGDRDRRSFEPIPELERTDADIVLAHLASEKRYTHPVDDPWFWAHRDDRIAHAVEGANFTATAYGRDRPITTLGCTLQHQICAGSASALSKSPGYCTPPMGLYQLREDSRDMKALNLTSRQVVTYRRFLHTAAESDLSYMLPYLSKQEPPLLAARLTQNGFAEPVPSDQWKIETNYWQSLSMAHMQRIFLAWATGQIATDTSHLQLASTPEERWMCDNQIIRGAAVEAFNVLGLALIFAFGIVVVGLSLITVDLVAFLQRRWNRGAIRREMWIANEALQLLRMVFEKSGQGTWHGTAEVVPVTELGEKLDLLAAEVDAEGTTVGTGSPTVDNQSHRASSSQDGQDSEGQVSRRTEK